MVFITHRWWNPAQNHPDDEDGSKYDIISRALEELIETSGVLIRGGRVGSGANRKQTSVRVYDWCTFATHPRPNPQFVTPIGVDLETTNVVIWIDYACIDQV